MTIIDEYKELVAKEEMLHNKLNNLPDDTCLGTYRRLLDEYDQVSSKRLELYPIYREAVINSCHHLVSPIKTPTYNQHFKCIKCELTDTVCDLISCDNVNDKVMKNYFTKKGIRSFRQVGFDQCLAIMHDYNEVKELYDQMIAEIPDMTDATFIEACMKAYNIDNVFLQDYCEREAREASSRSKN